MSTKPQPPSQPLISAQMFAPGGRLAVSVAGLLADDPSLREARLTAAQWQKKLATYLKSPRS